MKKCFSILFLVLALFFVAMNKSIAWEESLPCSEAEKYGKIDRSLSIYIDESKNPLNCVYENRKEALENFKKNNKNFVGTISSVYGLNELNESSLDIYISKANMINGEITGYNNEILDFNLFYNVYGNNERNQTVLEFVSEKYNGYLTPEEINEILPYMPEYSPIYAKYGSAVKGAKDEASKALEGIESHTVTAPSKMSVDQFIEDVVGAVKVVFRIIGGLLKGLAYIFIQGSS